MAKETIAKAPERRVRRSSINGRRNVLTVMGKDPEYEYRFVNDTGDRVQQFLEDGWEVVEQDKVRIGDKRIGTPTGEGSLAEASVGQGLKAKLLRIRKDWYDEDQAAKQEMVNRTEEATRETALDGTYGKLEISRDK